MARGKGAIKGKRGKAAAAPPAAAATKSNPTGPAGLPLPSPVAGTNLVIADIVLRAAGGMLRNRMERGLLVKSYDKAKADKLVDLVESLDGSPALLVYGFVEDLRVMQELYSGLPFLGNGTSDAKAALYEKGWNENLFPLLALHPASAGHGLNLQRGGNQMIVYDMPWSAELFDQTRKRFWRQGQVKRCFEHIILARDTIDCVKYDRVIGKMSDQEAFTRYLKRI